MFHFLRDMFSTDGGCCARTASSHAAEQGDELAPLHPIELHPMPLAAEAA
jgi:hypothetical protein